MMVGQKGKRNLMRKGPRTPESLRFCRERWDFAFEPFLCGCFCKLNLTVELDLMKGESPRLPEELVNLLPIKGFAPKTTPCDG